MKKYMVLAILPVLFQGALHASELNQVMQPELQNIKGLLKNPMISNDLDSALNALLDAVKNGSVGKDAGIAKVEALQKALENYKAKQYPNYFMSFFVSTPDIVKNEIQPALDKVSKALAELKASIANTLYNLAWDPYVNLGVGVLSVAAAAAWYKRKDLSKAYGYVKNKINPVKKQKQASAGVAGRPQASSGISRSFVSNYYDAVSYFAFGSIDKAQRKLNTQPNFVYFDGGKDVSIQTLIDMVDGFYKESISELDIVMKASEYKSDMCDELIRSLNRTLVESCRLYAVLGIDFTERLQDVNEMASAYNDAARKRPLAGYQTYFSEFESMRGRVLESTQSLPRASIGASVEDDKALDYQADPAQLDSAFLSSDLPTYNGYYDVDLAFSGLQSSTLADQRTFDGVL